MRKIKVTGVLYVDDLDVEEGPKGPLTPEAFDDYTEDLFLDEIEMELLP